ncbi:asparagine synthase (glutamine-hydrolyzing) [Schaalia sp. lx-100]|uniref:asparagine synthase (glutamine-hydrolyzing) n=1 Tax=Schaalia sp. lx-100 TaxID=2899081 RepID=UPI001E40423A|nr:asparagine synthase (glutamine-hydrolyzing) [Schaalia sp. lx-100]MCD4557697.1 asparagine synthase (glutamine-hydrolyzing) [Schaalia sp. lx-100]
MCGIGGYYGHDPRLKQDILELMNACQCHRGPDGQGVFTDEGVGLSHRRLAILARESGAQPMTSADGRYTIIYNGECYNYLPLRAELEAVGVHMRTDSDTEVVLEGFAAYGSAFFDRMDGMWGVAIWDSVDRVLTLSRDHFGIKPLYIADLSQQMDAPSTQGPNIVFASELKTILATGLVARRADDRTVYRYLAFRIHEDNPRTFFRGITRLMPGEMVTVSEDGIEYSSYTSLKEELRAAAQINRPLDAEAVREYQERLVESVRERLQSEVPVGTSLSGGLDSTTVALIINQMLSQGADRSTSAVGARQNTFSAVFPGSLNDEERYVDDALAACEGHVQAHKIYPSADQFKNDMVDFVRTQEEPTISTGPYAQYVVMREAAKSVTVLLDGQGADEMMAGYIPYYFVYFRQLRAQGRHAALAAEVARSADVLARLGRFTAMDKVRRRRPVHAHTLFNQDFAQRYADERMDVVRDNLKERLIQDLFHNSLPSLLRYEDRNTMRFSLEGRVPFLDKDTVKFLFSLSDEAIITSGWNKNVLRRAVAGLVPDSIRLRRNKIGFTTPEDEWFRRIKGEIFDILSSRSFGQRPWFNQAEVLKTFDDFINGRNDASTMLFWRLVNVELWARIYLDSDDLGADLDAGHDARDLSEHGKFLPPDAHTPLEANEGKQLDIVLPDGTVSRRYPLQTEKFSADSDMDTEITRYVTDFFKDLESLGDEDDRVATQGRRWNLTVSEKIIAIMQGRSWFVWEVKPSFAAKQLSKCVTRTPAGIGLGDPVTMQLAIDEAGLGRILYAAAGSVVGKLRGKKGVFYDLAGANVRAIDGPTEYSVYPSNVSAKLPPKDPDAVAQHLTAIIREAVPESFRDTFDGVVVMDANDIGRNVLGLHAGLSAEHYELQFADNPLGQGSQQTPMAVVFDRDEM